MLSSALTHWRTTLAGIGTIIAGIGAACIAVSNGHFDMSVWAALGGAFTMGLGLIHASDAKNVTAPAPTASDPGPKA